MIVPVLPAVCGDARAAPSFVIVLVTTFVESLFWEVLRPIIGLEGDEVEPCVEDKGVEEGVEEGVVEGVVEAVVEAADGVEVTAAVGAFSWAGEEADRSFFLNNC